MGPVVLSSNQMIQLVIGHYAVSLPCELQQPGVV